jgi:hypothetical protein
MTILAYIWDNFLGLFLLVGLGTVLLSFIYLALTRCPYCREWHLDEYEQARCQQRHLKKHDRT